MRRLLSIVLGLILMLSLGLLATAQDANPTVVPDANPTMVPDTAPVQSEDTMTDDASDGATLESVTGDTGQDFYGREVTLEGWVVEFVNARTFVLGEGAALDDDKVLVINNTSHELDLRVTTDEQIRLTGVVIPPLEQGGFGDLVSRGINHDAMVTEMQPTTDPNAVSELAPTTDTEAMEPTTDANAVPEAAPTMDAEPVQPTSPEFSMDMIDVDLSMMQNIIAERYPNYTILELTAVDTVELITDTMQ